MDIPPLSHLSNTWWQEVYKKVKNAVVFSDKSMCESLHWHGGVVKIFNAGALACKDLSSFESALPGQTKGVFLSSGPVVGTVRDIVRDIIRNSKFEHCVLVTAAGPSVQMFAEGRDTGHDMAAFQQLERDLLAWMGGNKEYIVELFSFPLFLAPITSNVFMMPIFSHVFPFLDGNFAAALADRKKFDLRMLPPKLIVSSYHLTSCLQSLLSLLGVNDDIYCMGSLSQIIGSNLETHPQTVTRRKMASQRASVILIDRNLDVASAASYSSDCLLDRIKASMPNLPQHSCDVAVDMTSICDSKIKTNSNVLSICGPPPGCLCHPDSPIPVIDWIINQKQYDVLLNLQKALLSKNNLRITAQSFERQVVSMFTGKHGLILKHSSVLQQALAVIKALIHHNVDMIMGIEKLQLMAIASGGVNEALNQLSTAIKTRRARDLTVEQLIVVLVQLYSVIGPDYEYSPDAELLVQAELSKAIIEDRALPHNEPTKSSAISSLIGPDMRDEEIEVFVRNVFITLRSLSTTRKHFTKYRSLLKNEGPLFPVEYNSLILQLLQDLISYNNGEMPKELLNMTSGNKSGLSSLLIRPNKHPMDNKLILLFVIGGITGQEVRQINELFKSANRQAIIGSTRFLSPSDVVKLLFSNVTAAV